MHFKRLLCILYLYTWTVCCSKVERVILVGIDGAGSFHSKTLTPNIWAFLRSGTYCHYATAQVPTESAENWVSILTGVRPQRHQKTNHRLNGPYDENSTFPTIFKIINQAKPSFRLASIAAWDRVNTALIEPSVPVFKYTANDTKLPTFLRQYLKNEGRHTQFIFIELDDLDWKGHVHGYGAGSAPFVEQYALTDTLFGEILDGIEESGLGSSSLVALTSDHGGMRRGWLEGIIAGSIGYGQGYHGGGSFQEAHVLLGIRGPGVVEQYFPQDTLASMDLSATMLHSLGIPIPPYFDAKFIPIFKKVSKSLDP